MHAILTNRARKIYITHVPRKIPSQSNATGNSITKIEATAYCRRRNRDGRRYFKQAGNFKYANLNKKSCLEIATNKKSNTSKPHYYIYTDKCYNS